GTGVDAQCHVIAADLDAVGPDSADARDLALAERDGKADRIGILGDLRRRRRPFPASARSRRGLKEPRSPDDLPGHAHPAPDLTDRGALRSSRQAETVDPPGLHRLRTRTHQTLVDDPAESRADG